MTALASNWPPSVKLLTRLVMRFWLTLFLGLSVAACGGERSDEPIDIGLIGSPESVFQQGVRLSYAAQHYRAATHEGLVALDPTGQIVPALAERWIVTPDGQSYIFRLRDSQWPDGENIGGEDIRVLLGDLLPRLEGTSLGLDLAKITEIRAMTGRVIEIRLSSPMPEFLRLLAQPELGFVKSGSGVGPMIASRDENTDAARLSALPPQARGLPALEDWEEVARPLTFRAMPAEQAVEAFAEGDLDILMNGRISTFPMAQLGPLSRGNIQVDPALGVFGLAIRNSEGVLSSPELREALSMAIDRTTLLEPFGLSGWQPTSWIIPANILPDGAISDSRWNNQTIEERRAVAQARIAQWTGASGEEARLRIALPEGPGSDLLFESLAANWREIGVTVTRIESGGGADLVLRDRLARYSSPRWYLNQFNCELEIGLCAEEADTLVVQSLTESNLAEKLQLFVEAHQAMVEQEIFIPLGAPVRWALVRGGLPAYQANQWGLHPLFPLSQPTI